jgi:hypothetical protein
MKDKAGIFAESERLQSRDGTTEEILDLYRRNGLSILESMQFFKQLTNITLAEAKQAVHFSETWSDVRAEHDRFHAAIEDVANSIGEKKG